jgi:purine-cytosine permease-like protein
MFPRALRVALAALWVAGALLAGTTAILSWTHHLGQAVPYGVISVGLLLMAVYTARGHRAVTLVGLAICALQPFAAIAAAWELVNGISASQVHKLEDLGIDPTFGVALNVVFSTVASVLAVWAYRAWRAAGRR